MANQVTGTSQPLDWVALLMIFIMKSKGSCPSALAWLSCGAETARRVSWASGQLTLLQHGSPPPPPPLPGPSAPAHPHNMQKPARPRPASSPG